MKKYYFLSILMVVLSDTLYHFASKNLSESLSPFGVFFYVYLGCFIVSFIIAIIIDKKEKIRRPKINFKNKYFYIFLIGLLCFDLGYIFIYRIGGALSNIYVLTMPLKAIVLLIAGYLLYKETLSKKNMLGIIISIIGVLLISM